MQSRLTVLTVIIILGVVVVASLVGGILLVAFNRTVPSEVWAPGTTALGAVAGILAKTDTLPSTQAPVAK